MDRNAILEDLKKLRPVRIVATISDAQQRRAFLGKHEARRLRNNLPIIVHANFWNLLQIDTRSFFSSMDFCAIDIRQKRATYLTIVVGTHLHLFHFYHCLLSQKCI